MAPKKLTRQEREQLEEAFRFGEANLRLEGLEPSPAYFEIRRRILEGEITWEGGHRALAQHYRKPKSHLEEVFAALDAAEFPPDFLSEADRDRQPPNYRPELEKLFEDKRLEESSIVPSNSCSTRIADLRIQHHYRAAK